MAPIAAQSLDKLPVRPEWQSHQAATQLQEHHAAGMWQKGRGDTLAFTMPCILPIDNSQAPNGRTPETHHKPSPNALNPGKVRAHLADGLVQCLEGVWGAPEELWGVQHRTQQVDSRLQGHDMHKLYEGRSS